MKKTLTIFALVYFVLEFATLFLIFGWNAFGGSNSMNIFQKAISFFFGFPSKWLFKSNESILLYVVPNTIFWTLVLAVGYIIWKKIKP